MSKHMGAESIDFEKIANKANQLEEKSATEKEAQEEIGKGNELSDETIAVMLAQKATKQLHRKKNASKTIN